jgi:release factor glutamine methyltransferase
MHRGPEGGEDPRPEGGEGAKPEHTWSLQGQQQSQGVGGTMSDDVYRPMMFDEYAARLRRWHEAASTELHGYGAREVTYLGLHLATPEQVFPPLPVSDRLGRAVLDEVRDADRMLDMGTGCGVNAILVASRSHDVVGVDVNPHAVAAAIRNAERNHVTNRTTVFESAVFETCGRRL